MRAFVMLVFLAQLAACVEVRPNSHVPKRGVDYLVKWVDMPEKQEFLVRLESLSNREICTGSGRWPSPAGYIGGSGLVITVRVGKVGYKYRDSNMEMCLFRECENPMKRGTALESVLTYEGFRLPSELQFATKELSFDPQPYWCNWHKVP